MSKPFLTSLLPRRSVYDLTKNSFPLANKAVVDIVRSIVEETPSAFNSQTTRAVVAFNDKHSKIWDDFAYNALKAVAPAEAFEKNTAPKLKMFSQAYGTVLFFEETATIKGMQEKFALYADKFPEWAGHSSGAAQILTWYALATEGVGANLQHYNPLIDDAVRKEFGVPESWELKAQLVFGSVGTPANKPDHLDPNETVLEFD